MGSSGSESTLERIAEEIASEIKRGCKTCGSRLKHEWAPDQVLLFCSNKSCDTNDIRHGMIGPHVMVAIKSKL